MNATYPRAAKLSTKCTPRSSVKRTKVKVCKSKIPSRLSFVALHCVARFADLILTSLPRLECLQITQRRIIRRWANDAAIEFLCQFGFMLETIIILHYSSSMESEGQFKFRRT